MNNEELLLQTQKNMFALLRYAVRLHCRHEATKGALAGVLAQGDMQKAQKILDAMDKQADKLAEGILMKIGDTNPEGADLLGIEEVLRKLEGQQ